MLAAPLAVYERNKEMYCHPIIWYHDVIHDTENVLTSVFNEVGFDLFCHSEHHSRHLEQSAVALIDQFQFISHPG